MTDVARESERCRCGHLRLGHHHYRPGTDCAHCDECGEFQRSLVPTSGPRLVLALTLSLAAVAVLLLALWP